MPRSDTNIARCQCMPGCKNPPLPDSPFCAQHKKHCKRRSPLSGAETKYNPDAFNKFDGIKGSNNCFAYAFDYQKLPTRCTKDKCDVPFPQPGRASGYPKWSKVKGKRCPDLLARIRGDIPNIYTTTFEQKCKPTFRKIAVVTDPENDYHFYRQDSNGFWSHKPGASNVTNRDATGHFIYDPEQASRKYPKTGLNYKHFCSHICIPTRQKYRIRRMGGQRTKRNNKRSSNK